MVCVVERAEMVREAVPSYFDPSIEDIARGWRTRDNRVGSLGERVWMDWRPPWIGLGTSGKGVSRLDQTANCTQPSHCEHLMLDICGLLRVLKGHGR